MLLVTINNAIRHESTEDLCQANEATPISGADTQLLFGVLLIQNEQAKHASYLRGEKSPSGVDACLEDTEQEANCHCT